MLTEVENDADNLRAALKWTMDHGDALTAQTMLGGWVGRGGFAGRGDEGWRFLTAGLACPVNPRPWLSASTAMWASYVGYSAGAGVAEAARYGEERSSCCDRRQASASVTSPVNGCCPKPVLLAGIQAWTGRRDEACDLYREAHQLYSAGTDGWCRAFTTTPPAWWPTWRAICSSATTADAIGRVVRGRPRRLGAGHLERGHRPAGGPAGALRGCHRQDRAGATFGQGAAARGLRRAAAQPSR